MKNCICKYFREDCCSVELYAVFSGAIECFVEAHLGNVFFDFGNQLMNI